ncbi:transglutaminase family protein [Microbacterium sp. RU33B]|uniref:transglutaminase family protein n=1 Tax=Microbacterium sp. RU33B TaxID=1907390 RepID=UPI00095B5D7D|nr:transglutaminase family protein [Microbacterium sp. RU33B]SIT83808.1 Transglutaminase-like enzyme, putative cysteine protease [Microbacterium sp. RU33B]
MRYRVSHRTTYTYSKPVQDSVGLFHLIPRELPWQQVLASDVEVAPLPGDISRDLDYFGNSSTYFHVTEPHSSLVITSTSEVIADKPAYDPGALAAPWEASRPLLDSSAPSAWRATEFALESARAGHVDEATAYAAASLLPGRPIGDAVTDLMHRIHADFAYDSTATTVTSTVADVMRTRAGVCQDFAHLALACLRGHGVAARYVSGYLATQPPPGKERIVGADASHAWLAVWMPSSDEWLAIDPTNNQWANDRYVTVAWGRDYGDVSPVKGIIYTKAKKSTLRVSVDVAPLEPAQV